jgi:hypothetical protein
VPATPAANTTSTATNEFDRDFDNRDCDRDFDCGRD